MGLSASMARLIMKTAQQSDLQREGQQINEQRTTLSNQVSALYNSLLLMDVPTAPSTQDFTRSVHRFTIGTTEETIVGIIPAQGGHYTLNVSYELPGGNLTQGTPMQVTRSDSDPYTYSIGNYQIYSLEDARQQVPPLITAEEYESYIQAFRNTNTSYADTDVYPNTDIAQLLYMCQMPISSGRDVVENIFIYRTDLDSMVESSQSIQTYNYNAGGMYTAYQQYTDVDILFGPDGNVISVTIPTQTPGSGAVAYMTYNVTTSSEVDTAAFDKAMNDYEYDKYMYNRKQNEINQQQEIIHRQDKNLELKLTQLDAENSAIKTEIDAIKKVVDENLQRSFKVFGSG